MARIARIILPRKPHLVCQGGPQPIYHREEHRRAYLSLLYESAVMYGVKVLAWSVLPRQVHLVAIPPSADSLGSFMRVTQARYARFLHAQGHRGEVTQRRFASCVLDPSAALDAIKFVEAQPVELGLASEPMSYAFCSAAARGKNRKNGNGLLVRDDSLTGKIRNWSKWHTLKLAPNRVLYLAQRLRTGKPAGDEAFVRRLEAKLGMNLSRKPGRPSRRRTKAKSGRN